MINELLTDIKSEKQNIIFDKPKSYGTSYYTIDIYNADINYPLQKFWFHISKSKIIEKTDNYIVLVLSTNNNNDNNLINYINELEHKIFKTIQNNLIGTIVKIKYSFNRNKNYPPTIKLDIRGDISFFDQNDETIDIKNIENNMLVTAFIELNNIIISEEEIWILWRILQIKKLDTIDFKKSFFKITNKNIEKDNIIIPNDVQKAPPPPPPPLPAINLSSEAKIKPINIVKKDVINKEEQNKVSKFIISESDILNQLNKLKKTKDVNNNKLDIDKEKKEDEKIVKYELKKVQTKEPINTNEWYRKSLESEIHYDINYGEINDNFNLKLFKLKKILNNKLKKIYDEYNLLSRHDL